LRWGSPALFLFLFLLFSIHSFPCCIHSFTSRTHLLIITSSLPSCFFLSLPLPLTPLLSYYFPPLLFLPSDKNTCSIKFTTEMFSKSRSNSTSSSGSHSPPSSSVASTAAAAPSASTTNVLANGQGYTSYNGNISPAASSSTYYPAFPIRNKSRSKFLSLVLRCFFLLSSFSSHALPLPQTISVPLCACDVWC